MENQKSTGKEPSPGHRFINRAIAIISKRDWGRDYRIQEMLKLQERSYRLHSSRNKNLGSVLSEIVKHVNLSGFKEGSESFGEMLFTSLYDLADKLGLARNTVYRCVDVLEAVGYLSTYRHYDKTKSHYGPTRVWVTTDLFKSLSISLDEIAKWATKRNVKSVVSSSIARLLPGVRRRLKLPGDDLTQKQVNKSVNTHEKVTHETEERLKSAAKGVVVEQHIKGLREAIESQNGDKSKGLKCYFDALVSSGMLNSEVKAILRYAVVPLDIPPALILTI